MRIGFVIVNYNTSLLVIEAVRSAQQIYPESIVVIDNGSREDEVTVLNELNESEITVIFSKTNLGFSGGNNLGIKLLLQNGMDLIILLNSDAKIINPSVILEAIDLARDDGSGIVSVQVVNPGGKLQQVLFSYPRSPIARLLNIKNADVNLISGVFWIIKGEIFRLVGLLDESYFMYGEDFEFSYRVEQKGFKNSVFPKTGVFHLKGSSNNNLNMIKWQQRLGRSILWNSNNLKWHERLSILVYGVRYLFIHSKSKYLSSAKIFFKI